MLSIDIIRRRADIRGVFPFCGNIFIFRSII